MRPNSEGGTVLKSGNTGRSASGPRTVRLFALLGALASLWVLSPAAVAAADPPGQEFTIDLSGSHFLSNFCGSTIAQEGTAHVRRITFYDGRVIEHIDVDLQLMANGRVAFEMPRFTVEIDPTAGTVTLTGTLVNIHAPGEGLLLQDVGRVVQDLATGEPLFSAGRIMIAEGGTREGLLVLLCRRTVEQVGWRGCPAVCPV